MASVTCLLSGLRLLEASDQGRYRFIVKGAHALHVYASVYWVDYLLCITQFRDGLNDAPELHTLLSHFCTKLDRTCLDQYPAEGTGDSTLPSQLARLEQYGDIHSVVKQTLYARSPRNFEQQLLLENGRYITLSLYARLVIYLTNANIRRTTCHRFEGLERSSLSTSSPIPKDSHTCHDGDRHSRNSSTRA